MGEAAVSAVADNAWAWLALIGLGAYHGLNPGMGWLFAVALGLQEKRRRAVLAALPPIALGHALSVGLVLAVLWVAQASLPHQTLRYAAAALLFGFGLYRIVRSRHPAWVGMRVGFKDLTVWSFLMASAHGAGLMLVPILLGSARRAQAATMAVGTHAPGHDMQTMSSTVWWPAALSVHTLAQFAVAGVIAVVVYERLGLRILQSTWFNLDLLWVIALMLSGLLILVI
jgi:hypothetical protein